MIKGLVVDPNNCMEILCLFRVDLLLLGVKPLCPKISKCLRIGRENLLEVPIKTLLKNRPLISSLGRIDKAQANGVPIGNPERVRGFPVEINLEEGENNPEGLNDGENENVLDEAEVESGYVPTTPPKSDQGSDREQPGKRPREGAEEKLVPGPPDPGDPDDPEGGDSDDPSRRNIPELEGNLLFQHESRGHWPYDCGCDACVQARGRTPARRVRKKIE